MTTRRVARIWKRGGGGYFERVRKVQTTLTRILIFLNQFQRFVRKFRRNFLESSEIRRFFPPKIRWSLAKFGNSNVSGGAVFLWAGLFSIFQKKSASKALKTCDFAYFTNQWGGARAPPLATLLVTTTASN